MKPAGKPLPLPIASRNGVTKKEKPGREDAEFYSAVQALRAAGSTVFRGGGDVHLVDGQRVTAAEVIARAHNAKPKAKPSPQPPRPKQPSAAQWRLL